MKRSKSYRSAAEKIDADKAYAPLEAVRLAKSTASAKYDETVEIAFRLGVDPRKADQMVRGTVNLPHGTGKTARVLVFANGDKAEAAKAAGADYVGSDDLHREGRRRLARLRRRRRDPRPHGQGRPARQGARPARPDAEPEDRHRHHGHRQGRHRHQGRQDRVPRRQARATCTSSSARSSFDEKSLVENYAAALDEVLRLKPAASKGRYITKATLATTMGPGIPLDSTRTRNLLEETVEA